MNKITWCTQFSDQECSDDNCCLQNENNHKWNQDNKKDNIRNLFDEKEITSDCDFLSIS